MSALLAPPRGGTTPAPGAVRDCGDVVARPHLQLVDGAPRDGACCAADHDGPDHAGATDERARRARRRRDAEPRPGVGRRTVAAARRAVQTGRDRGAATAEYAVTIIAAVGLAGLLVTILASSDVRALLLKIVKGALTI